MRLRILFLTILLGIASNFSATPDANFLALNAEDNPQNKALLLPPPATLMVTNIGTTWATLSWTVVPGAHFYRIVTKEVISGLTVNDQTVPGTTLGVVVNGLTPGVEYQSQIWSIDNNGQQSATSTFSDNYTAIIFEVIVAGYQPNYNNSICILGFPQPPSNNGSQCDYTWSDVDYSYFRIKKNLPSNAPYKRFKVKIRSGGDITQVSPDYPYEGDIKFTMALNADGSLLYIKYDGVIIATLTASHPNASSQGKLYRTALGNNDSGYIIEKMGNGALPPGESNDRTSIESPQSTLEGLNAKPSPFSDQLEVTIPFTDESQDLLISLYDLQGRLMLNQIFPGGEKTQTLSTENILPGLYFLHVQSGNMVKSIRVMKTQ